MKTRRTPSYRLHRPSSQAVVTLNGRDVYLGRYGSPESRAEYDRIIAEWLAGGRGRPPAQPAANDITVAEIMVAYWKWASQHYPSDSERSGTLHNLKDALKPVRRLYGHTPAAKFGPLALKAVRKSLVDAGLARSTINGRIGKVKQMFRWAVENELLPGTVAHALDAVKGLQRGRDGVRETEPVKPVSDEHVAATLPFLSPAVRAMVELQRVTGMRPGEVMSMRTGELDRSGPVWVYRPTRHKTANRGKSREVPIGPRGQAILLPWLKADPDAHVFSPRQAVEQRNERRRSERKTPMTPSQRKRTWKRKPKPKRTPRDRYQRESYRTAVVRACDKADVPRWHPNQLRHALATEVRHRFGLEHAQVVLGHTKADITQVYAAKNLAVAADVMAKIG